MTFQMNILQALLVLRMCPGLMWSGVIAEVIRRNTFTHDKEGTWPTGLLQCFCSEETHLALIWEIWFFATRPRMRLLAKWTNGWVQDWDFLIIKSWTRPGRDRESRAFRLKTETRTWRDLTNFSYFQYFGTRPGPSFLERKTNGQVRDRDLSINKSVESLGAISLETEMIPRVSPISGAPWCFKL